VTPLNILDNLADSLALATIDENWKHRLGRQTELRARFNAPDLTVRQLGHFQIINLEGHEITIGSMATDEQIAAEIANIRQITEKPMSITGAHTLSASIKEKIQAAKDRMAKSTEGTEAALKKFNSAVDVADSVSKSIETEADELMKELGQFTNGGPA
jgi:hypothetical protein